jgi:hypothetical protein
MRLDACCVKQSPHSLEYTQELARILQGPKLFQATAMDKLDCSTVTGVVSAPTPVIFLCLPLHKARGM